MTSLHANASTKPSGSPAVPSSIRVSTDDVPAREQVPFWREVVGRHLLNIEVDVPDDVSFRGEAVFHGLPGLTVASMTTSGGRGSRTRELIARGSADEVLFSVTTRGTGHLTWFDRELIAANGEAALVPIDEPSSITLARPGSFLIYGVPVVLLKPLVPNVGDSLFRLVPYAAEPLRLLVGYSEFMLRPETSPTPELRHAAAAHMRDLIALALGASRDGAAMAEERGLRAARLQAIKAEVMRNAGSPELSVGAIARRHRLSPRSVQMLFEAEGLTFSQFVLEQRLMLAHRALSNWNSHRRSITDVALDSGFSNVSYFNRAFRNRFGASPGDVRARHMN